MDSGAFDHVGSDSVSDEMSVSHSASRLAEVLVAVVCCAYVLISSVDVLLELDGAAAPLTVLCAVGILAVQLGYVSRPGLALTPSRTAAALIMLLALVLLPIWLIGPAWVIFAGFLMGGILTGMPLRWSVPASLVVVAGSGLVSWQLGDVGAAPWYSVSSTILITATTGLVIFGLTRLARLTRRLHDARHEIRRMVMAEERLRFSRDAHDTLGLSLSTVTLKAELAHRLTLTEPDRVRAEITDVLVAARRALGEVRLVAAGRASLSLDEEMVSAPAILEAAEIDTSVLGDATGLPDHIATIFATLLREAVTNVLRHSKADVCHITVSLRDDVARIVVTNDRAGEPGSVPDERCGTEHRGIDNMRQRFEEVGGTLEAVHDEDEFHVVGTIPLDRSAR